MGRRILVLLTSVVAIGFSQLSFALGLGEVTLKSALNQPLKAEIQLLEVRDLSANEILVGLASAEDFERVGVDRPYFLTGLKFRVVLDSASGPIVLITSTKPVREPYLNFVLQAQWPSGRLLREYTLLMDLPVFSGEQAAPVSSTQTAPRVQPTPVPVAQTPQPAATADSGYNPRSSFDQAPPRPSRQQTDSTPTAAGDYGVSAGQYGSDSYQVQANDTLWDIARTVRPDRGVSIQQTMLALQRVNPEAFINNNINLLKKGQILRIPGRGEISEYSKTQAINEVAVQNTQWSGDPNGGYAASGRQLQAGRNYNAGDSASEEVEGRVKLASTEDYSDASEGRGAGAGESSIEALENELAITLEQLDRADRENSDLRSRIASLEEQISTMERMIEITNEDMKALELSAEKNRAQASADEAPQTADALSGAEDDAGMDSATEDAASEELAGTSADTESVVDEALGEDSPLPAEETQQAEADVVEAAPTPVPSVTPNKVVRSAPPKKTIVDHLMDNIIFVALGLVAILVAVFAFMKFRESKEETDGFEDDFLEQPVFDESAQEDIQEETLDELDLGDLEEPDAELEAEAEVEEEHAAEPQTEDAVAEADIYIAYGKYDQAEEMLLKAIENDPQDAKIRTKLLEVYSVQQDIDRFDEQYGSLLNLGVADANERAAQLREAIPGAAPFDISAYEAVESHLEAGDSLDEIDTSSESDFETDMDELSLDLETGDDDSEDFSLDLDLESSALESLEDADELDLSLDDEDSLDLEDGLELDDGLELSDTASRDDSSEPADADALEDHDDDFSLDIELPEADADLEISAEDFDLDLDSEETPADEPEPIELGGDDLETPDADIELEAEDFDLGSLDLEGDDEDLEFDDGRATSSNLNLTDDLDTELLEEPADVESADAFDLELGDIDEELSLGDSAEDSAEDDTNEFDLGDLEDLSLEPETSDESGADAGLDLAEGLDLGEDFTATENAQTGQAPADLPDPVEADTTSVDDLDLDDDLDLSALDEELDALTSDLEVEGADIADVEMTDMPAVDADNEDLLAQPTVMEEPVTDFDDLEEGLEFDAEGLEDLEDLEALAVDEPEISAASLAAEALEDVVESGEDVPESDEDLFDEAIAEVPESDLNFEIPDVDPEGDDDDLGFLSDSDETATKLDLARAYIDMGDSEGAKDILDEILKEGNEQQKQEAESLLAKV